MAEATSNNETNKKLSNAEADFLAKRRDITSLLDNNCETMELITLGTRSKLKNILTPVVEEAHEVSDMFATFRTLRKRAYRGLAGIRNDLVQLNTFKEVDSEAQYLMRHFERLTLKIEKVKDIGTEFDTKSQAHIKALRASTDLLAAAGCVKDLEHILIPDFQWVLSVDVLAIDAIAEEWHRMGLKRKLEQLIREQEI